MIFERLRTAGYINTNIYILTDIRLDIILKYTVLPICTLYLEDPPRYINNHPSVFGDPIKDL